MSSDPADLTLPADLAAEIDAARAEIDAAALDGPDAAEAFRVRFLGRKSGALTDLFARMGTVPPETRRALGQALNALKARAEERLDEARQVATSTAARTDLDLTLPGRALPVEEAGGLHPLTQALRDIERIFRAYGFDVATGPEIETDWHNFTALGFPEEHPARDMQDTFFLEPPLPEGRGVLLRTHTSPVQIRVMEGRRPPFRVIVPGRVFRNEAISYKSFCLFHQVEGLVVDETASMADLQGLLRTFARAFFGREMKLRFRPSYFPFTEPSAEVDVWWADETKPGGGRWMEILGCGMVDPVVLENVGVDPERYTGYAFGMGAERLAMLRHDIADIRLFYENDVRFLQQF